MVNRVIKGKTSSVAESNKLETNSRVEYFIITNKSAGTVLVNLSIENLDGLIIQISPMDMELKVGECFEGREYILIMAEERLIVEADGGEIDFYFALSSDDKKP